MYEDISVRDAVVDSPNRIADDGDGDGMTVDTAIGTRYVKSGDRVRHVNYPGKLATVEAVGPDALDLTLESGEPWSGTSRVWEPVDPENIPAYDVERVKIVEAAAALEDITVMLKTAVTELRQNARTLRSVRVDDVVAARLVQDSYARVFALRRKLGRVVAGLGAGTPAQLSRYEADYDKLVQD